MTMTLKAWVVISPASAAVRFSYHPSLVDAIKAGIPAWARSYTPATKTWTIDREWVSAVLGILRTRLGPENVQVTETAPPPPPPPPPPPRVKADAKWAVTLFTQLPKHLREPAYKALLKVLHPDIGGDDRIAQQLNDGYHDVTRWAS